MAELFTCVAHWFRFTLNSPTKRQARFGEFYNGLKSLAVKFKTHAQMVFNSSRFWISFGYHQNFLWFFWGKWHITICSCFLKYLGYFFILCLLSSFYKRTIEEQAVTHYSILLLYKFMLAFMLDVTCVLNIENLSFRCFGICWKWSLNARPLLFTYLAN